MSTFSLKRTFDFASNDQSNSQPSKKAKFYVTLVKPTAPANDQTGMSGNSVNQRALVYKIVKQPSIVDAAAPSSPSTSMKTNDLSRPNLLNEEEALEAHDKSSTSKSNFLAPQLSISQTNDEFQTSTTSARNTGSNLTNMDGNRQKMAKFIGDYEIIREANSDQQVSDQKRAFIVKELDGSSNIGLCRCITFEKYLHYFELYGKLSAQCSEDANFCDDSSSDEVMERLWPRRSKLFISRDEISGEKRYYLFTPRHYGSLHVHVVDRKKLDSLQALRLYKQIVEAAAYCHSRGIILRDVKLRKFVFADEQRRNVRFFDLDEFHILVDPRNDTIRERNGCPAYVSPEIIDFQSKSYSGKPADMWSLGVLLYVMLVGRYPFYDTTPVGLFLKIRSAQFGVPLTSSEIPYELRCTVRFLLRKNPQERLTAVQLLRLPCLLNIDDANYSQRWKCSNNALTNVDEKEDDHVVPDLAPKFRPIVTKKLDRQRSQDQDLDFLS